MAVRIKIDNRLRLDTRDVPPDTLEALKRAFTFTNPSLAKLQAQARRAKGAARYALEARLRGMAVDVALWEQDSEWGLSLPRGCLSQVRDMLRLEGLSWAYQDARCQGHPAGPWHHRPNPKAPDGGELRWYQQEAIEVAIARQNCLLRAPTGSGKTSTAIGLIARLGRSSLVVVDSGELLRQWVTRLCAELGLAEADVGVLGAGRWDLRPVTVAMRQTLAKRLPNATLEGAFGVVVVDEVHRAAATTFRGVVDQLPAFWRIGVSADETRPDKMEPLVYAVFGPVAYEVTRNELIQEGSVLDVECLLVMTPFEAPWYVEQRAVMQPDHNRLLDEMTAHEARNQIIAGIMAEENARGSQVLMLTHRVDHAKHVRGLVTDCGLALGGVEYAGPRAAALDEMRARRLRSVCGTVQSLGTGIDLPSVEVGVLATPIGNNRQLYGQIRGRLCRPAAGKRPGLYVLWDHKVTGAATLRRMLEWNTAVQVRDLSGVWRDGRAVLKEMA